MGLSKKQRMIFAFPHSHYDFLICDGSIRSGKTICMMTAFVGDAMARFTEQRFGICGKTVDSAIKNVLQPYLSTEVYTDFGLEARFKRGEKVLEVTRLEDGGTNLFEIFGGKDESSYTLIQGRTLAGVLLDEVALMPRSFVEQALARCSVEDSKIWFNCNPEGASHWFNREWVERAHERNAMRLHFTMEDNPSISPKMRQRYEAMYSGVFYDRYIRGLWVAAEGLIYDMFSPSRHVVPADGIQTDGFYYVSADYGIQNATVFLLWGRERGTDRWILCEEWYYSGREQRRQKTVSELVEGLRGMLGDRHPYRVIIDPSAAALEVELRKAGYSVQAADNDVINGIADVGTMLGRDQLAISDRCENTIRELQSYRWDEKAAESGIDRPIKEDDHCMDALRYFVRTMRIVKRTR